jgi:hypothetical protein
MRRFGKDIMMEREASVEGGKIDLDKSCGTSNTDICHVVF